MQLLQIEKSILRNLLLFKIQENTQLNNSCNSKSALKKAFDFVVNGNSRNKQNKFQLELLVLIV